MKYVCGMSGGVDSSVSLYELKKKNAEVVCVYLDMHSDADQGLFKVDGRSEMSPDVASAYDCASKYSCDLYVYNCREDFERYVIGDFVKEYSKGRTPNPCTVCNRYVKIHHLLKAKESLGADAVCTGHYASKCFDGQRYYIKANPSAKDQSYMLWRLSQEQLEKLELPLGMSDKKDVKAVAEKENMLSSLRKESYDICFIPDGDYAAFIEKSLGKFPKGDIISPDGLVCGTHNGIIHYTVGQRKGLGVALGERVFVKHLDIQNNTVQLGRQGEEFRDSIEVADLNFQKLCPTESFCSEAYVKVRYAAGLQRAEFVIEDKRARVAFCSPVRAPTPGQSAVFYDNEQNILFGGIIE